MASKQLARSLKWLGGAMLVSVLLAAGTLAVIGWNWLRAPIERQVLQKTGRVFVIGGDLKLLPAWPLPRLHASRVSFANPQWAINPQMLTADAVEISVDPGALLDWRLAFPEVRLERPVVFLERGPAGRKSWLLDLEQQDEQARILIGHVSLDHGSLGYDDPKLQTSVRSSIATAEGPTPGADGVIFNAVGRFKGLGLKASGTGGPVMALRDDSRPYPLKVDVTIGQTRIRADGTATSLTQLSALDIQLSLSGSSLEQLFPLLGIAAPPSNAYAVEGHLVHQADTWRYDKLRGRVGKSDIAGSVELVRGGKRPLLTADLVSRVLDTSDLGPLIGAKAPVVTPADGRVLPELPFKTDRWDTMDADVKLTARTLRHPARVPLEDLVTRMTLKDAVLTLDPLAFGFAGGHLDAVVTLDGRSHPIAARAQVRARKVQIAKLMPTFKLGKSGIGQINGEFDLGGKGDSVRQMLATSNGKLGLVIANGEISKLMMETAGLHLWEILELKFNGDRPVKVRCGVADFDVTKGVMQAQALVFDTAVTTILGTGTIDLAQETLDLTLNQKTKNTSPLALRSPIYVRGSLAHPQVGVNKGQVAARALGAIALGVVNPLLALVPLVDPGPGQDSDCRQLVRDARAVPRPGARAAPDRR